jgi:hypothetical protein
VTRSTLLVRDFKPLDDGILVGILTDSFPAYSFPMLIHQWFNKYTLLCLQLRAQLWSFTTFPEFTLQLNLLSKAHQNDGGNYP